MRWHAPARALQTQLLQAALCRHRVPRAVEHDDVLPRDGLRRVRRAHRLLQHARHRQSVSVTERHSSPDNSRAVTATTATARTASSANRSQSPWKSGSCRPLASPMMHSIAATPALRRAVVVIIRLVSFARLSRLRLCCCACAQQGGFGVAAATRRRRTAKSIAVQSGIFAGLGEARAVRIRSQRILVQRRGCGLSRVAVEL